MVASVLTTTPQKGVVVASWTGLAGTETGDSVSATAWADKTIQAAGTFTTITVEGSNDGVNWSTLNNLQGDPLAIAAPGLSVIAENPLLMRVSSVGAAGATVTIVGRNVA